MLLTRDVDTRPRAGRIIARSRRRRPLWPLAKGAPVKKCTNCAKDIPDTAFHCVFCGAKQGTPQAAGPAQKTIMGYAAADLQKLLPQQQGAPQQGGYPPPAGADQRTMMAGVGGAPLPQNPADQRTMM